MIRIQHLNKSYEIPHGVLPALKNISLDLPDQGLVFVLGKSGSGKTTLLNMLSGLDSPDSGELVFNGNDIGTMSLRQLDRYRNRDVGIIFQEYNLIDTLSVRANVALALELQGENKDAINRSVDETLSFVGLDSLTERKVTALSGGQRQRVAIARALIKHPKIIFADEPTGNLDSETGKQIFQLLQKTAQTCLVVVISHDESAALQYADSIVRIADGNIQNVSSATEETCFSATVRDGDTVREIRAPSAAELQRVLLAELQKNPAIDVHIERKAAESKGEKESDGNGIHREEKRCTPLPFKRKAFFARHNLLRKPIRSFFVIMLFSLALFLLMTAVHVSAFNRDTVIEKYIQRYQVNYLYPYYSSAYENSLCELKTKQLTGGNFILSELQRTFPDTKIVPSISDLTFTLSAKDFSEDEIYKKDLGKYCLWYCFDTEEIRAQKTFLYGRKTETAEEIVITDYLAYSIFGDENAIGKHLVISDVETEIVGILKTSYLEYGYARKVLIGKDFAYTTYLGKREFEVVLIHPTLLDAVKEKSKSVLLKYADFSYAYDDTFFSNAPALYYIGVNELDSSSIPLLAGTWPQNENEVLVTDFICNNRLIDWQEIIQAEGEDDNYYEKVIGNTYSYPDYTAEEYDHYYSDHTLISGYLPEVTVVGVIDTSEEDSNLGFYYDIVIDQAIYEQLREDYWQNEIYCDYGLVIDPDNAQYYVKGLTELGYSIDEPSIATICTFASALESANTVLAILVFAVLCLTVLVLFAFISYSISTNHRQLGILRAIGVTGKDTLSIFALETGVITVVSLIISFVFDILLMRYANAEFAASLPMNQFDIIVPNALLCIVTVLITVAVSFISSALPIWNLSRKVPIDIIRNG